MDEIQEELEHQKFLSECNRLMEAIFWSLTANESLSVHSLKTHWDDIDMYGDEPMFTSVLMDALIADAKELA